MCLFFSNEIAVKGGNTAWGLTTADINADGLCRPGGGDTDGNTIPSCRAMAAAVRRRPQAMLPPAGRGQMTSADLDGDGKADVIVTLPASNTVMVFLNNGAGGLARGTAYGWGPARRRSARPTSMATASSTSSVTDAGSNQVRFC